MTDIQCVEAKRHKASVLRCPGAMSLAIGYLRGGDASLLAEHRAIAGISRIENVGLPRGKAAGRSFQSIVKAVPDTSGRARTTGRRIPKDGQSHAILFFRQRYSVCVDLISIRRQ